MSSRQGHPLSAPSAFATGRGALRALAQGARENLSNRTATALGRFAASLAVVTLLGACSQPDSSTGVASAPAASAAAPAATGSPAAPAAAANDYASAWGPKTGSQIPLLAATDHTGTPQTLASLSGDRGLLLVFSRSADW